MIYPKHRWLIVVLVIVAIVSIGCKVNYDHKLRAEWEHNRQVLTVAVQSGDTLDEFGYNHKPSWMDVREWRYQVMELNGMEDANLLAGQRIKIYTEGGIQNAKGIIHD